MFIVMMVIVGTYSCGLIEMKPKPVSSMNNILSVEQPSATFLRVELGVTELVSDPARKFEEIRFVLGEGSTIKVDGTSYPLTVPSGQTSGLKIKTAFSIEANIIAVIFDVQDNLAYNQGNGYSLKPVVQEARIETCPPSNVTYRDALPEERAAISSATNYLDNAENIPPEERETYLLSVPNITRADCESDYCVYWLSTGVQISINY